MRPKIEVGAKIVTINLWTGRREMKIIIISYADPTVIVAIVIVVVIII